MKWPRYAHVRPSGLMQFGDIPNHWTVAAISYRYEVALGKMLDEKRIEGHHLAPYLRNVDVQWGRIDVGDLPLMDFDGRDRKRYSLRAGDLLVCEGGEVGRAAIWKEQLPECFYQKALHRLRPRDSNADSPEFLLYALKSFADAGHFTGGESKSTIAHLTAESLRRYRFPFPTFTEQRAIAAFLDRETARLDELIEKKRRLVALLQERRAAFIVAAVTRGLNHDAPTKDSEIEWLGRIPAHWEVMSLAKLTTKLTNGYVGPTRDMFVEEGVPYLQSLHIKENRVVFGGDYFVTEDWSKRHAKSTLRMGDVLVVQTGDIGQVSYVPAEWSGANCHALIICSPDTRRVGGEYLAWLLASEYGQAQFGSLQTGALHPHLNCGDIKHMSVPVPPLVEQQLITTHIVGAVEQSRKLCKKLEEAVSGLLEYRASLITAAVTGQIDVRRALATEPAAQLEEALP